MGFSIALPNTKPLYTEAQLPVKAPYAHISTVAYHKQANRLIYGVSYFASLEARQNGAKAIRIPSLPSNGLRSCSGAEAGEALAHAYAHLEQQLTAALATVSPTATVTQV